MGVAYSQDLRDRVMAAVDGGLGVYTAAPLFGSACRTFTQRVVHLQGARPAPRHRRRDGPQVGRRAEGEACGLRRALERKVSLRPGRIKRGLFTFRPTWRTPWRQSCRDPMTGIMRPLSGFLRRSDGKTSLKLSRTHWRPSIARIMRRLRGFLRRSARKAPLPRR